MKTQLDQMTTVVNQFPKHFYQLLFPETFFTKLFCFQIESIKQHCFGNNIKQKVNNNNNNSHIFLYPLCDLYQLLFLTQIYSYKYNIRGLCTRFRVTPVMLGYSCRFMSTLSILELMLQGKCHLFRVTPMLHFWF